MDKKKRKKKKKKTTMVVKKITDWAARSQPKNSGAPQGEVIPALLVAADLLIHRLESNEKQRIPYSRNNSKI